MIQRYFRTTYRQHNPIIPDGPSAIAGMIPKLTGLAYEPGMAVTDGDLVMSSALYRLGTKADGCDRYLSVEDGKVVEHSDMMQEEAPPPIQRVAMPCSLQPERDMPTVADMSPLTRERGTDVESLIRGYRTSATLVFHCPCLVPAQVWKWPFSDLVQSALLRRPRTISYRVMSIFIGFWTWSGRPIDPLALPSSSAGRKPSGEQSSYARRSSF